MGVETIGEAFSLGWRIVARCVRGREDGPSSKSSRECTYRRELGHSAIFHAPAAVVLEIKAGPYEPQLDKEFASWSPAEDDLAAARFVTWLETAAPGERV